MTEQTLQDQAEIIVADIIDDLTDRRGLADAWYSMDEDIQNEIRDIWIDFVVVGLKASK